MCKEVLNMVNEGCPNVVIMADGGEVPLDTGGPDKGLDPAERLVIRSHTGRTETVSRRDHLPHHHQMMLEEVERLRAELEQYKSWGALDL